MSSAMNSFCDVLSLKQIIYISIACLRAQFRNRMTVLNEIIVNVWLSGTHHTELRQRSSYVTRL